MSGLRPAHRMAWIPTYTEASVLTHVHAHSQARMHTQTLFAKKIEGCLRQGPNSPAHIAVIITATTAIDSRINQITAINACRPPTRHET